MRAKKLIPTTILEDLPFILTLITAWFALFLDSIGRLDEKTLRTVLLLIVCSSATIEIVMRRTALRRIEHYVLQLLEDEHGVQPVYERSAIWDIAQRMLKDAKNGWQVYDTSSIANNEEYEAAIQSAALRGARVVRFVCCAADTSPCNLITMTRSAEIYHLPYCLPMDCLIIDTGDATTALVGLKTSHEQKQAYTSGIHIKTLRLAGELLSTVRNVYLPDAQKHLRQATTSHICLACRSLKRQQEG